MKISGRNPLKGMGGEGKERRGARLDILSRGPEFPVMLPVFDQQ